MEKITSYQSKLIEDNADLAHYLAQVAWARSPETLDIDDLVSAAYQGLISAAVKFDPSRMEEGSTEAKLFSGYARQRIRGAILDWMRNQDHVPRNKRISYKQFQKLGHGHGKSPEELADLTNTPIDKVKHIIQVVEATTFSLDSELHPVELVEQSSVEGTVVENRLRSAMMTQWNLLTPLQQAVVSLRYYQGLEFPAIAEELQQRLGLIRQEHEEAVLLFHSALKQSAT